MLTRELQIQDAAPLDDERGGVVGRFVGDRCVSPESGRSDFVLAKGGDRAALTRVLEAHQRMVRAVLLATCRLDEVDDLVQEVFLCAMTRLDQLRDEMLVGPWLATIARSKASDWRRSVVRRLGLARRYAAHRSRSEPGRGREDAAAEAERVLMAIRRLPEEYRDILIMRMVEQFTGPEISRWTGRSHAAVRVALHRGMTMLRKELGMEVMP